MKLIRWIMGAVILAGAVALIVLRPLPFLFYPDLPHVEFVALQSLAKGKDVLRSIVPLERRLYRLFGSLAAHVPRLGQDRGVSLPIEDGADDPHSRGTRDQESPLRHRNFPFD